MANWPALEKWRCPRCARLDSVRTDETFAVGGLLGTAVAGRLEARFGATVVLRAGLGVAGPPSVEREAAVDGTLSPQCSPT